MPSDVTCFSLNQGKSCETRVSQDKCDFLYIEYYLSVTSHYDVSQSVLRHLFLPQPGLIRLNQDKPG